MDERTRAATCQDVLHIVALLEAEGVEHALIGGYALALQGIVRLTEGADILVEPSLENARRWVTALSKLPDGAAAELAGDDTLHEELYAIRTNDEFTIDIMNSASGYSWTDLLPYRTRIDGITVISLAGLLRMKEGERLKDRADAEAVTEQRGSGRRDQPPSNLSPVHDGPVVHPHWPSLHVHVRQPAVQVLSQSFATQPCDSAGCASCSSQVATGSGVLFKSASDPASPLALSPVGPCSLKQWASTPTG